MRLANERQHYFVMLSLIGSAHTQNDPWCHPQKSQAIGQHFNSYIISYHMSHSFLFMCSNL